MKTDEKNTFTLLNIFLFSKQVLYVVHSRSKVS